MNRSQFIFLCLGLASVAIFSSCSSAKKERLEQREKLANSAGLYCDFVNGEKYTDVEVMVNLEMAKRCDSAKPFSISNYKSPAEVIGMMYCCATAKKAEVVASSAPMKASTPAAAPAAKPNMPSTNVPGAMIGNPPPSAKPAPSAPAHNNIDADEVIGE